LEFLVKVRPIDGLAIVVDKLILKTVWRPAKPVCGFVSDRIVIESRECRLVKLAFRAV
jgi:hypothetical protein